MNIGRFRVPSYGICIVLGVMSANIIALFKMKRNKTDLNDFILLEAYTFLGAFFGAKILYLWVSRRFIDWNRVMEPRYFNQLMTGGFVFYGGLIGGLIFCLLAGKIHGIYCYGYIQKYIFLIPWIHCFGRIGCFMAGCCYGIPYDGIGAVTFPAGSFASAGVSLFPVQLAEAAGLLLISIILLFLQKKAGWDYSVETYFVLYGALRFILEYFRNDAIRGKLLFFSTSQWISLCLEAAALTMLLWKHSKKTNLA